MVLREKPIFLKTVVIIVGLLLVEAGVLLYVSPAPPISGHAISDFTNFFSDINPTSRTFLVVQWVVIAFILLVIFFKNRGIWRRNSEKKGIDLEAIQKRSKTNLDALYEILKVKKQLSIRSVCDLFKLKEELAMEWARILEAGELATIEYPGLGSPVIILKEKKSADKKEKDDKSKKEAKDEKKVVKDEKKPVSKEKVVGKNNQLAKKIVPVIKSSRQAKKKVNKLIKELKKEHKQKRK